MCRMAHGAALVVLLALGPGSLILSLPAKTEEPPAAPAPKTQEPPELRLPPDLVYEGGAEGGGAVIFRHTTHAALAGNNCLECHPQLFKILHSERKTSHDEMGAGKACGACHDGKKAFGVTDTDSCQNCHTGVPAPAKPGEGASSAAPRAGPKDVRLAQSEGSPGTVTFRHSSHGGATAKCARCHPALFPMQASGKPLDYAAMLQGATCGTCHNGKEAFGVDDSERCERCHAAEEATP